MILSETEVSGRLVALETGSVHAKIEALREIPRTKGKAAHALVAAYDDASALVKMIPERVAHFKVTCTDDATVSLDAVNPVLAVEMLSKLIEDEDVTHIVLAIEPTT